MCLYAMLRDKELPIPRTLTNKRVVIDFADQPAGQSSIKTASQVPRHHTATSQPSQSRRHLHDGSLALEKDPGRPIL